MRRLPLALRLGWLLFDLDGVLVDSRRPIAASINHALRCEGLEPEPEEELRRWIGPPLFEAFSALLLARGADPARAEACIGHYREHYRTASLSDTRPLPGIAEALARLGRGRTLAVATSKPAAFATPILERLGLAGYFAGVFAPPLDGTHLEGKTETVGRAVDALAARPAETAMIGDRHLDVEAGRAGGLVCIGVTWGIGARQELVEAGAHHLVESAPELVALVEELELSGASRRGSLARR